MPKKFFAIAFITALSAPSVILAEEVPANKCYAETVKAQRGVDPALLSTVECAKALRLGPHTDQQRSAMLHNRAIIERAKGDTDAALASLHRSVGLAPMAGKPHLALAQLLHINGDYAGAISLYRKLTTSNEVADFVSEHRPTIMRNMASAQQALARERAVAQVRLVEIATAGTHQ